MLLFGASRAQLTDEIIRPKLEQGVTVVADRFDASSMAYQGHARGLVLAYVKDDQRLRHEGNPPGPEHPVGHGAEHRTGPDQGAAAGRRDGTGNPAGPGGNPPVRGATHRIPPESTSWIPGPGQDGTPEVDSDRRDDAPGTGARGDLGQSSADTAMTPREALIRRSWKRIRPLAKDGIDEKPPVQRELAEPTRQGK